MSTAKDLNIDNYDLNDILALFKIPYDFDENDLKAAKKIVLKTHPDKSGLGSEYFLFYSKAYKVLFSVFFIVLSGYLLCCTKKTNIFYVQIMSGCGMFATSKIGRNFLGFV